MSPRTVLVVLADAAARESLAGALAVERYAVLTAATFREGRALLVERQPDALVTSVRLGDHNGIHLAIVSRLRCGSTKTLVIGYGDRVLEAEAGQAGAVYLTDPDTSAIMAALGGALNRIERRWPRGRANVSAQVSANPVRLLDVSYGGFRIELPSGCHLPPTDHFDLAVGDVRVDAHAVWIRQGEDRTWCGATVAGDGDGFLAWREFVDTVLDARPAV